MSGKNNKRSSAGTNTNWAKAARDVFLKALDKGQVLPLAIALFFVIAALRLDPKNLYSILDKFTDAMIAGESNFTIAFFAVSIGWATHIRSVRKGHSQECDRLGKEKSDLQNQLSDFNLGSSNNYRVNAR
jgi:hypothetical protein